MIDTSSVTGHCSSRIPLSTFDRGYYRPSAREVAQSLLGHWLLRRTPEGVCGGEIVETEAYLVGDPACHAYERETPRNKTMWGQEGHAYVFRIYGAYFCFNPVCGPPGVAEAVLIRAMRPTLGVQAMRKARPVTSDRQLLSGPGKLCQALSIGLELDGADICDSGGPLWIARNPDRDAFCCAAGPIVTCTRIGITRGAELPLRFYLESDPNVSRKARAQEVFSRHAIPEGG
jgi:DNA-3-methyladenine glycosylase